MMCKCGKEKCGLDEPCLNVVQADFYKSAVERECHGDCSSESPENWSGVGKNNTVNLETPSPESPEKCEVCGFDAHCQLSLRYDYDADKMTSKICTVCACPHCSPQPQDSKAEELKSRAIMLTGRIASSMPEDFEQVCEELTKALSESFTKGKQSGILEAKKVVEKKLEFVVNVGGHDERQYGVQESIQAIETLL